MRHIARNELFQIDTGAESTTIPADLDKTQVFVIADRFGHMVQFQRCRIVHRIEQARAIQIQKADLALFFEIHCFEVHSYKFLLSTTRTAFPSLRAISLGPTSLTLHMMPS